MEAPTVSNFITPRKLLIVACLALAVFVLGPQGARAQSPWRAKAGAETKDQSVQADGFFPNELWILAGDSIEWTFAPKNEVHTVTFLAPNQVRPMAPPPVGPPPGTVVGPPPGTLIGLPLNCAPSAASATYTGSNCVTSNPVSGGATFTVTFPNAGNYKLVCLVHTDMNGTVHVLPDGPDAALLQTQRFLDDEGSDQAEDLLKDRDHQGEEIAELPRNQVAAGIGEIAATGGGTEYRAVLRFLNPVVRIHKGESVTWANLDPTEPHTVTFGTEPPPAPAPFVPTTQKGLGPVAADLTLTATVNCPNTATCDADFVQEGAKGAAYVSTAFINSGFLQAAAPDRTAPAPGDNQEPPGTTRITITFPVAGDYFYHCAIHDTDGMYGEVIVLP